MPSADPDARTGSQAGSRAGSRAAARLAALIAMPVALLTGVGLVLLLTNLTGDDPADTGPVAMAERELTEWEETVCRALLSQLPGTLDTLAQRPVTAGPEQNAAYGDPPVTLACAVPEATFPPTDTVYPLPAGIGACWHLAEGAEESVWTTVDREVPVRVTVPASYDGPGQLVVELSAAVAQTVRPAETAPPGCLG